MVILYIHIGNIPTLSITHQLYFFKKNIYQPMKNSSVCLYSGCVYVCVCRGGGAETCLSVLALSNLLTQCFPDLNHKYFAMTVIFCLLHLLGENELTKEMVFLAVLVLLGWRTGEAAQPVSQAVQPCTFASLLDSQSKACLFLSIGFTLSPGKCS